MEEYLLKVGKAVQSKLAEMLLLSKPPAWIRLATLSPLSNFGYPPGSEGYLLAIHDRGVVVGVEDREDVPRDFVPWSNVCYLTDGSLMAKESGR